VEETMTVRSAANPNPVLIKHYLKTLLAALEEKAKEKKEISTEQKPKEK
jgi:hypothetical protein